MELEITPQPAEREAIVAAVEKLLTTDGAPAAYRSAWRRQALRENVEDGATPAGGYGAAGRPRSKPGATRA